MLGTVLQESYVAYGPLVDFLVCFSDVVIRAIIVLIIVWDLNKARLNMEWKTFSLLATSIGQVTLNNHDFGTKRTN